ncbi:MAG: YcgN family cysteine cluster protein [Gammaproteobacteria bacterium]|nr:YcgN family cysteine cluster protein [Gammaproteobacteria bacterium]
MNNEINFWETKSLDEMSDEQWEMLCDGCGRCCLVKLEDEDDNKVYLTNVACKLLDLETCRCSDYSNRIDTVSMCMDLKTELAEMVDYLPETCAYRLLYKGNPLESWHPLMSSNPDSVRDAGASVNEFAVSEEAIHPDQVESHIIASLSDDSE